jgi:hypothetical protein
MAHVGQVGTFLLPEWRRRGLGRRVECRRAGVLSRPRFQDCGRLSRQVIIDGIEDDEVLLELFIDRRSLPLT